MQPNMAQVVRKRDGREARVVLPMVRLKIVFI